MLPNFLDYVLAGVRGLFMLIFALFFILTLPLTGPLFLLGYLLTRGGLDLRDTDDDADSGGY